MVQVNNVTFSNVSTALKHFGEKVKKFVPSQGVNNGDKTSSKVDELQHSDFPALTQNERMKSAVKKFNALNEQKIVAETNFFAELDNEYKLLQEYKAFNISNFKNVSLTPVSYDTVSLKSEGKTVEIRCKINENGNKYQVINFDDGSKIEYTLFTGDRKMKINGEEFEMPAGTVVETKSVNGRIFSQLIQIPELERTFINKPECLDRAEQILKTYKQLQSPKSVVMPTKKYILTLLAKASSARPLLDLSTSNSFKTSDEIMSYLKKNIAEGKLPKDISITGESKDGRKILTIPGENCKYEICGSEMRVIDNNEDTKMIARYEGGQKSHGLWIILYDKGKPVNGSHYTSLDSDKPSLSVKYIYNNDNTVTAKSTDVSGKENVYQQNLPEDFCLVIEQGFKFVSPNEPHLGEVFEYQTPYTLR